MKCVAEHMPNSFNQIALSYKAPEVHTMERQKFIKFRGDITSCLFVYLTNQGGFNDEIYRQADKNYSFHDSISCRLIIDNEPTP